MTNHAPKVYTPKHPVDLTEADVRRLAEEGRRWAEELRKVTESVTRITAADLRYRVR